MCNTGQCIKNKNKDKKNKDKREKKEEEEEYFVHRNDTIMSLLKVWQVIATTYFLRVCVH